MKAARRLPVVDRRITTALAIGYLVLAPVSAIATNSDAVGAVPTASVQQVRHHQGLDYWAIAGAPVSLPNRPRAQSLQLPTGLSPARAIPSRCGCRPG